MSWAGSDPGTSRGALAWGLDNGWKPEPDAVTRCPGPHLRRMCHVAAVGNEHAQARALFAETLDLVRTNGAVLGEAWALEALGTCAREEGEQVRASALFADALALARERGDPGTVANCLKSIGAIATSLGRDEQAARLFGAAEAAWERSGFGAPPPVERERRDRVFAPIRDRLPTATFAAAWSSGRDAPLELAVDEALILSREAAARKAPVPVVASRLTPREVEVLRYVADGLTDREIAAALFVSRNTAANHVANILGKLAVPNRAAAAAYAVRHGLV